MSRAARALVAALVLAAAVGLGVAIAWQQRPHGPAMIEHVVRRGDTLAILSGRYDVTVDDLRTWNGIDGDLIEVGQVLKLVPGPHAVAPDAHPEPPPRPEGASVPPRFALPPERPCLPPPDASALGDQGIVAAKGLSPKVVKASMDAFLPDLEICVGGEWPEGTVTTAITVACSGRVATVEVLDPGGLDPALVACVADALRYAAFPAHDMPDGFRFEYPVRFER